MWGWFFTHLPIFRSVCLTLYKDFSLERHWLGYLFSAHLDGIRLWKNETDLLQDIPLPSHRAQGMQRWKVALDSFWSPLILSWSTCETEVGEGDFSHKSLQTSNGTWICTDGPMNYLCCSHLMPDWLKTMDMNQWLALRHWLASIRIPALWKIRTFWDGSLQ